MRGQRKCGTCICFEPLPDIYKAAGCKLPICECRTQDKTFGIAFCENYLPQKFLDTSYARTGGGRVDGMCRWVPPPGLKVEGNVQRNSESSWCHCWQPIRDLVQIDDLPALQDTKLLEGKIR